MTSTGPDDFDWIVRDDKTDPKGFWRVDKELPFRERLTGLAAAAFRALKEGKWTAGGSRNLEVGGRRGANEQCPRANHQRDSGDRNLEVGSGTPAQGPVESGRREPVGTPPAAEELSNDEFFELLGIPELTNPEAARAKGLPGPLILKRTGCHVWRPEAFPPDDPRYGWTWEHCRQDAVALLGSAAAVEEYLAAKPSIARDSSPEAAKPFRLRYESPKRRSRRKRS